MIELKLGQQMRDKVSGFAGIATTETEFMTGNVQFSLQPPAGGIFGAAAQSFDVHQLEYAGVGTNVVQAPADTGIELGFKVKDIVSGVSGIATQKTTFLNGCIYYAVVPEAAKDATEIKDFFIEYKRLNKVSVGVTPTITKRLAEEQATGELVATGGPSFKVPMRG